MPAVPPYAEGMSSGLPEPGQRRRSWPALPRPRPAAALLQRGRFDLVFVADVVTAVICWAVTYACWGPEHPLTTTRTAPGCSFLVSLLLCAPLVLRNRLPAHRVVGVRAGLVLGQPGRPADLDFLGYVPPERGHRLRPVPVRGRGPRQGLGSDRHGRGHAVGAVIIDPGPPGRVRHRRDHGVRRGHRPLAARQPRASWRSPNAATRGSAPCSKSASASPGNCTTSLPTTCQ